MHIATSTAEGGGTWLGAIADWAIHLMDVIGPVGAGIALAIEAVFPPIPSEAVLPLAGLAASRGSFTLAEAIIWTTIGSVVGAIALYWLGAAVGVERLKRIAAKMPLVEPKDVDRAVAWFDKYGAAAVFFGRFIPMVRSLISIPAGMVRMPMWRFLLYTSVGSGLWNTLFVMVGFKLGEQWHVVEQYMEPIQRVVIVVVLALIVWFIVARVLKHRRESRGVA